MDQPRIEGYYKFSDEKIVLGEMLNLKLRFSYLSALDVGCGNGEVSHYIAQRTADLHLCEINPFYEEELRTKFPHAVIEIKDIKHTILKEYDLIFFSQGLYYHPKQDWHGIIDRLMGSLAPGGEMIVVLNSNKGDWWEAINSVRKLHPDVLAFSYLPSDELIALLSLKYQLEFDTFCYQIAFPNVDERNAYLRKSCVPFIGPHIEAETLLETYINDLGERVNFKYYSELISIRKR
jgi:SAM-dependent methyltransferase